MDSPVTGVLSQLKEAPPEAVKVSVTGPAATRAWAWKGIATKAPEVVVTVAGRLSAALAPLTLTCAGTLSARLVRTLLPPASASSRVSTVAVPVYRMSTELSRVCNWLAVPLSTSVRRPLTSVAVLSAALVIATAFADGALRVSVNVPWTLVLPSPSSSSRPVKTRDEAVALVMARLFGSWVISGLLRTPLLLEVVITGAVAVKVTVLVTELTTFDPLLFCIVTVKLWLPTVPSKTSFPGVDR